MSIFIGGVERRIYQVDYYVLNGGGRNETVQEILTNSRADRLLKKIHTNKIDSIISEVSTGSRDNANIPEIHFNLKNLNDKDDAINKAKQIEMQWANMAAELY